jgi:hypothetical protein
VIALFIDNLPSKAQSECQALAGGYRLWRPLSKQQRTYRYPSRHPRGPPIW